MVRNFSDSLFQRYLKGQPDMDEFIQHYIKLRQLIFVL